MGKAAWSERPKRPDPTIGAVRAMVRWAEETPLPWEGTLPELLGAVKRFHRVQDPFPTTVKQFAWALRRAAPLLGKVGLEVSRRRPGDRWISRVSRRGDALPGTQAARD